MNQLLKPGARGEDVRQLQRMLNEALGANLAEDGVFGPRTAAAVQAFQQAAGLQVDGHVGPEMQTALMGAAGGVPRGRPGMEAAPSTPAEVLMALGPQGMAVDSPPVQMIGAEQVPMAPAMPPPEEIPAQRHLAVGQYSPFTSPEPPVPLYYPLLAPEAPAMPPPPVIEAEPDEMPTRGFAPPASADPGMTVGEFRDRFPSMTPPSLDAERTRRVAYDAFNNDVRSGNSPLALVDSYVPGSDIPVPRPKPNIGDVLQATGEMMLPRPNPRRVNHAR